MIHDRRGFDGDERGVGGGLAGWLVGNRVGSGVSWIDLGGSRPGSGVLCVCLVCLVCVLCTCARVFVYVRPCFALGKAEAYVGEPRRVRTQWMDAKREKSVRPLVRIRRFGNCAPLMV